MKSNSSNCKHKVWTMIALTLLEISGRHDRIIIWRLEGAAAWGKVFFTIAVLVVITSDYLPHAHLLFYNMPCNCRSTRKSANCDLLILKAGNSFPRWNIVSDATRRPIRARIPAAEISALSQSSLRGCIRTLISKTGNMLKCMLSVSHMSCIAALLFFFFFFYYL